MSGNKEVNMKDPSGEFFSEDRFRKIDPGETLLGFNIVIQDNNRSKVSTNFEVTYLFSYTEYIYFVSHHIIKRVPIGRAPHS